MCDDDRQMRLRNFCFTLNNYDSDSLVALKSSDKLSYLIVGKEVGESGTPHLQGYCELKGQLIFKNVKKLLPTAHIEKRFGSAEQASKYCKKDGEFEEIGEISQQGARTDIYSATRAIAEGVPMRQVAMDNPVTYVKYYRGLDAFRRVCCEKPRNKPPKVVVLYGPTGTGKSKRAREFAVDPWIWTPLKGNWFDGYYGQDTVIFEEYRGQFPLSHLLVLLDRYSVDVQVKGGSSHFSPSTIVLTSPLHPRDWYPDTTENLNQLFRRITEIIEVCPPSSASGLQPQPP